LSAGSGFERCFGESVESDFHGSSRRAVGGLQDTPLPPRIDGRVAGFRRRTCPGGVNP
jgi:hypothetical protein